MLIRWCFTELRTSDRLDTTIVAFPILSRMATNGFTSGTINLAENLKALRTTNPSIDGCQIKDFTKYWVSFSSHIPGEGFLHFYKSKPTTQRSTALFIENLANMTNIGQIDKGKKQYMLKISYADHYVLLLFSSLSTMQKWYKRMRTFLNCYPLFLLKCPQQPHRVGHYIMCFNVNNLIAYSTHSGQRIWTWNMGHLRRFSYEPKVPFIEIESGRSSETGEGNFYFTGGNCKELFDLLDSLSQSGKTPPLMSKRNSVPAESIDIAKSMEYLELLQPSSVEESTSKLVKKPVITKPHSLPAHFNSGPSGYKGHHHKHQSFDSGDTIHKEFRHYTRSQSTDTAEHISADVTGSTVKCLQANCGPVTQANDSRAIYAKLKLESVTESVFNFDYANTDHVYEHIDDDGDDDDGIYI